MSKPARLEMKILGMDCAEEIAVLKREIGPVVGGEDRLSFDLLRGKMTVEALSDQTTPEKVIAAVGRTGMKAALWQEDRAAQPSVGFWGRRGRTVLMLASGVFLAVGYVVHAVMAGSLKAALGSEGMGVAQVVPVVVRLIYGVGVLSGLWYFLPKAWLSARRLRPDMNLLMTIAIVSAVLIGEWIEAAMVAFLFSVALALETWSIGRARHAVEKLMQLAPMTARVVGPGGQESDIRAEDVPVGSRVLVRPGEKVPLDGRVVEGTSDVDQAPITGESAPVAKKASDTVFAGTLNGTGALLIETTKKAGDTTLARIVRLVEEAQAKRSTSEQWVEKFARYYTPGVLLLAAVLLIVPPLLFGGQWSEWIYRSLVLLVIACPCALVISTPVSVVAGLAAAARHGVLVKGGVYLEAPARIGAIAFDKTGTLTRGKPAVADVIPMGGHTRNELLESAAAIEARSEHPVAEAILRFVRAEGLAVPAVDGFQAVLGKGATARVRGKEYWLGSHRYLEERGQETAEVHDRLEALSREGKTVVVVGDASHVCGLIALADEVRPESAAMLRELRDLGIQHLVMLTGDNRGTAERIGTDIGLTELRAELLPEDKVKVIEELAAKYGSVAMVGDGVNDAPALARATLGIAMGAAGSDAAIETADVALMSDDISNIPWLVRHSRKTLAIIRQNIVFSLAVKAVFVGLTFLGHASLWSAIAADMGASLLVIFNGLRLLRVLGGGRSIPNRR